MERKFSEDLKFEDTGFCQLDGKSEKRNMNKLKSMIEEGVGGKNKRRNSV